MNRENIVWRSRIVFMISCFIILALLVINARKHCRSLLKKLNCGSKFLKVMYFDAPYLLENSIQETDGGKNIDWASLYPFHKGQQNSFSVKKSKTSFFMKILSKVQKERSRIAKYYHSMMPFYYNIINASGFYKDILFWQITCISEYNSLLELDDNYFVSTCEKEDMSEIISSIFDFCKFCNNEKIPFLYVQAPSKVSRKEAKSRVGNADFSNENIDKLIFGLKKYGVDYLDIRDEIEELDKDHHDLFFQTDHHWKPETGLWVSEILSKYVSSFYRDNTLLADIHNSEMYRSKILKKWFLGSLGKKVTLARADPEDFVLLYPIFDTKLSMCIPSLDISTTGNFNMIYDTKKIISKEYMTQDPYLAYCYGNRDVIKFLNHSVDNDLRVLLIKDSFGNTVAPFLASNFGEFSVLDIRHFTGSLRNYICSYRPDFVFVLYNPSSFGAINWSKHKSPFDFR